MMQSFALMALITVMWALVGYSFVLRRRWPFYRELRARLFCAAWAQTRIRITLDNSATNFHGLPVDVRYYHAGIDTGATAERMKFSGTVLFLTHGSFVVYAPLAHMVWGKGGLLNASLGGKFPTLDFAGGTVVHISSGVSALVCALYLGKRTGYPKQPMPPHSLVLSSSERACSG